MPWAASSSNDFLAPVGSIIIGIFGVPVSIDVFLIAFRLPFTPIPNRELDGDLLMPETDDGVFAICGVSTLFAGTFDLT